MSRAARRLLAACALLTLPAAGGGAARAQPRPAWAALAQELRGGRCDGLTLTWTSGPPGLQRGPQRHLTVRCDAAGASAALSRCDGPQEASCPEGPDGRSGGADRPLSTGERERLLSALRALDLGALAARQGPGADADSADRRLTLRSATAGGPAALVGAWALPRGDWPAPAGTSADLTLPAFLDELTEGLARARGQRRPVRVPASVAELARLRLQLRLTPGDLLAGAPGLRGAPPGATTTAAAPLPTGVLTIAGGAWQLHQDPPAGALAAVAPPPGRAAPTRQGTLTPAQQEALLAALRAALDDLPGLSARVPRRQGPALDDRDGRLATLTLLPAASSDGPAGIQRYLSDLRASPAGPLMNQLLSLWQPAGAAARAPR